MFVTTSVAQGLAFASKVATAMVIPQFVSFVSIYSLRRAMQISFFASVSDCITILLDIRFWQHSSVIPKLPTKVSARSWLTFIASIAFWAIVLTSDLLVYQLANRHTVWMEYKNRNIDLNFKVTSSALTSTFNVSAPTALLDSTEAFSVFGNNTYLPAENYRYMHTDPTRHFAQSSSDNSTFEIIYDVKKVIAPSTNGTNFTCRSGQQVSATQVSRGLSLVSLRCKNNNTPSTAPYYPSIGFNNPTNLLAFQGYNGAHFSFMTSRQRDKQRIRESGSNPTTTKKFLKYTTENYTLISQQVNGTSVDLNLTQAFDFLKGWKTGTENYKVILAYYKIDREVLYSRVPKYTYKYLIIELIGLAGTQDSSDPYAIAGLIYFNYISYTIQNVFVPGKSIDEKYLGIDAEELYGPRSTSILTDLSPEHTIITMLANPGKPTLVKSVEVIDAWPALLLIILAAGISLALFLYRMFFQLVAAGGRIPFDPFLELFHSAVNDDFRHRTMDSLLVKMQDTDLIMVNGYSPDTRGNKIGLVPRNSVILPFDRSQEYR